jgi:hypothetical protein
MPQGASLYVASPLHLDLWSDLLGALQAAWVIQKIGVRKTTLFGVVLNSLAVLLASFSTESLGGLIFLQGVVAGIACGTLFMVSRLNHIVSLPIELIPFPDRPSTRFRHNISCVNEELRRVSPVRPPRRSDIGKMIITALLISMWRWCRWCCMVVGTYLVNQRQLRPHVSRISQIIQKLIDKFGLPWAYRFMGEICRVHLFRNVQSY